MGWFNYYGLTLIFVIMLPNIIYAGKHKDDSNSYNNKIAVAFEQIGRYSCMVFMILNIPYTLLNFWFDKALIVYLAVNGSLCLSYVVCWIIFWNKNGRLKALFLSILPSAIFVFSGIMLAYFPLLVAAVIFAVSHILISYKNA